MPTPITHALVALAVGRAWTETGERAPPPRFWLLSAAAAVLPDADVVAFRLGIPYEATLGHRGLSHSFAFAALVAAAIVLIGFRQAPPGIRRSTLATHFFGVTASHGIFDAMTLGGLGVAFFSPFDGARYFLPWRPVGAAPISISPAALPEVAGIILEEALWFWLPAAIVLAAILGARRLAR